MNREIEEYPSMKNPKHLAVALVMLLATVAASWLATGAA